VALRRGLGMDEWSLVRDRGHRYFRRYRRRRQPRWRCARTFQTESRREQQRWSSSPVQARAPPSVPVRRRPAPVRRRPAPDRRQDPPACHRPAARMTHVPLSGASASGVRRSGERRVRRRTRSLGSPRRWRTRAAPQTNGRGASRPRHSRPLRHPTPVPGSAATGEGRRWAGQGSRQARGQRECRPRAAQSSCSAAAPRFRRRQSWPAGATEMHVFPSSRALPE
jgi:hypothetical protein